MMKCFKNVMAFAAIVAGATLMAALYIADLGLYSLVAAFLGITGTMYLPAMLYELYGAEIRLSRIRYKRWMRTREAVIEEGLTMA